MKINISDEVLAEIGKIVVVFNLIEHSLAKIIGGIVTFGGRRRELGTILTTELSFRQRVDALSSLLLLGLGEHDDTIKQFKQIRRLLLRAQDDRNKIVHSVWANQSISDEPHAIVRIKTSAKQRKGLRTDFISMDLEDLRQVAKSVGEAYGSLCVFELQFQEEPNGSGSQNDCEKADTQAPD